MLRRYQIQGINQIIKKFNCRALLADEMGLGKSIQAIKVIQRTQKIPAIICCPGSLKYNWVREFNKFAPEIETFICNSRTAKAPQYFNGVYIINYEILHYWTDYFSTQQIKIMVLDESHYVKNYKSLRTKAAFRISRQSDSILLLTGTPIENKPVELFYQIQLINRTLFPSWLKFAKYYNSCRKTMWGWEMGKAKNTEELHNILIEKCMIRRKKKDVLTELPPIIRQIIPLEIDNREDYNFAKNDFINWIRLNTTLDTVKATKTIQMAKIDKLKYISAMGKINAIAEWAKNESENQKLVIFCYHRDVLNKLNEKLKNHLLLSSETTKEKRDIYVERFQNDENTRIILTTLKVGGIGLTLTAAHTTVFVQLDWVPTIHDQAEARVHRISQTSDVVNAIYFIAQNTIEEKIMGLIDGKREDISKVIDGKDVEDSEILTKLMKDLMQNVN